MLEIPLRGGAANSDQTFSAELDGRLLDFELKYISYTGQPAWSMNIYQDGTPLVLGAMLEPGADVIDGYEAGIGHLVFTGAPVTLDNLGVANHLVWVAE